MLAPLRKSIKTSTYPWRLQSLAGKQRLSPRRYLAPRKAFLRFIALQRFTSRQCRLLKPCAASDGGKEALAHAVKISSGGPPIFLVAEEETFTFTHTAGA